MIDPNELRKMADEIDHNIELEQEKLKQERKVRKLEKKRREHEEAVEDSDDDVVLLSVLNQMEASAVIHH